MIFICDSCHYLFEKRLFTNPETNKQASADPEKLLTHDAHNNVPSMCPSCGASCITYKIETGDIQTTGSLPAVRYAAPREIEEYVQAVNIARSSKQKEIQACKKTEEALAILHACSDRLSNDEYNLLLIFVFFVEHSAKPEAWLEPVLGISRFRPSPFNSGRAARPEQDVIRAYENMLQIFSSMVKGLGTTSTESADAYRIASLMRKTSEMTSDRESSQKKQALQRKTLLKTIRNIPIESISEAPGQDYLEAVRKLLDLSQKKAAEGKSFPTV